MKILHIDCSPRPVSHSRRLSAAIVARMRARHPEATVVRRDLGLDPLPHAEAGYAAALSSPDALAMGLADGAMRLSERLIQEVEAADILVIGTPMNNFTVPSVLKAWIDQILRIGRTFSSSPSGKIGLLRDRPVFIGIASGSVFTGERANQPDFLTPYVRAAFGCIGLNTLHFLPLQATAFLDEDRLAAARETLLATI
ncbi:flavodoxin family protein [Pigmentiphaga sp. H8]|uniref:FMN-dependent NADH-azoreductase n=1 Tax=unclassified Pigmentiphaga TaxID=2626614 RepID=UPI000F5A3B3F|nr:NAD(P)H-dependent oxidoreductase [Pigmentiphaga sp. H8]AZG09114.1 flavodoxin family protein [Pigmentiphaga sp. H8]